MAAASFTDMCEQTEGHYQEYFDAPDEVSEPTWKTRDGRALRPVDMETQHIQRSLYMMMRNAKREFFAWQLSALCYASTAPDGAAMAAEQAATEYAEMACDPAACLKEACKAEIGKAFMRELACRGVTFDRRRWRLSEDNRAARIKRAPFKEHIPEAWL